MTVHIPEEIACGLAEFELGDEGLSYVRSQLDSANDLNRGLLDSISGGSGPAWTMAPATVDRSQLLDFKTSLMMSSGPPLDVASAYVESLLAEGNRLVVVPDYVDLETGTAWGVEDENSFTFADFFHHYGTPQFTREELAEILSLNDFMGDSCAWVCDIPPGFTMPQNGSPLSLDQQNELVRSPVLLLTLAYDGEGWVYHLPHPLRTAAV